MNKKIRQERKMLKFKSRIKRFVANGGYYYTLDLQRIDSPTVQDVINDGGYQCYKTTSCPCNCYMCSGYYKHDRAKQNIADREIIAFELEYIRLMEGKQGVL
jgi:hypothetical protein